MGEIYSAVIRYSTLCREIKSGSKGKGEAYLREHLKSSLCSSLISRYSWLLNLLFYDRESEFELLVNFPEKMAFFKEMPRKEKIPAQLGRRGIYIVSEI